MEKLNLSKEEITKFNEESVDRLLTIIKDPKWEQFEDDPCNMYSLKVGDRIASKGEAVIRATPQEIDEFLSSEENQMKLSSNVKEFRTIQDLGDSKIRYRRHEGSWPVQDRDFIMCSSKKYDGDRLIITSRSIESSYPEVPSVTRAECYIGGYVVDKVDATSSKVTFISDIDLKGSIPNMIQKKLSKLQAENPWKLKLVMGR